MSQPTERMRALRDYEAAVGAQVQADGISRAAAVRVNEALRRLRQVEQSERPLQVDGFCSCDSPYSAALDCGITEHRTQALRERGA